MGCVEGETGSCNETVVTCDVDGTEENVKFEEAVDIKEEIIKVEEAIDIKDETPEALIFPPIKTEQEVRLWVFLYELVGAYAFTSFIGPK
jgi:hypothetical protein